MSDLPEPRSVLHCVAGGGLYGIERMLLGLLPAQGLSGWKATLACIVESDGIGRPLGERIEASGGSAVQIEMRGRVGARGMVGLNRLLRSRRPDVLHVHGYKASILAGGLGLLHRLPVVATYHAEARKAVGLERHVATEALFIRWFHGMAAVSEAIGEELVERGVRPERIRVIPNGATDYGDLRGGSRCASNASREGPIVATASRLIPEKNLHLLIRAFARLRAGIPGVRLRLAGDGPLADELRRLATGLGVGESVEFLGFVDDIGSVLRDCDCFVLPSQTEGMPIALLEAMSAGCPCVASAVGSIPSIAESDRNLVLVEPGDEHALERAITRVLADATFADALSRNGRSKFLRDHTTEAMARAYAAFYADVLARPG